MGNRFKARRSTIRLRTGNGAKEWSKPIKCLLFGEIAVHASVPGSGAYSISHVRSGFRVCGHIDRHADAREIAGRLARRPEWADIAEDGSGPDRSELGQYVFDTKAYVQQQRWIAEGGYGTSHPLPDPDTLLEGSV